MKGFSASPKYFSYIGVLFQIERSVSSELSQLYGESSYKSQQHSGKIGDRFGKTVVLSMELSPFHPEVNDAAAAASREAVPEILLLMNAKAHSGVIVEGTIAFTLGIEINVLTDEIQDGNALFDALRDRKSRGHFV